MTEIVTLLEELGMPRSAAKVLTHLQTVEISSPLEIQEATNLSQPVVSTAVKYLRERWWISETHTVHGRGRPKHSYKLSKSMVEIVDELEKEIHTKISLLRNNLEVLKDVLKS